MPESQFGLVPIYEQRESRTYSLVLIEKDDTRTQMFYCSPSHYALSLPRVVESKEYRRGRQVVRRPNSKADPLPPGECCSWCGVQISGGASI